MPKTKLKNAWDVIDENKKQMTKTGIQKSFSNNLHFILAKDRYTQTPNDEYVALAIAVRDRIVERWIHTQQRYHKKNLKRVYYLSLEFLIGRLLGNNMLNLELEKEVRLALEELGVNLEEIHEEEPDAGLGNGGLGRLAACFLDSLATLGIPAHGYGIRYDYGIFNQKIQNGYQVESPDEWLKMGNPWEFQRPEYAVTVKFYGQTSMVRDVDGKLRARWENTQDVIAMPYDIPVTGYANDVVNTLRLWAARSSEEFDLEYFNHGDYEKAVYHKMLSENISKVLYPNDSSAVGRELRLKQEYFFTAASISDIIRRFKIENKDLKKLPEKAAIQLNDTHPALAVAEFLRVLVDQEDMEWKDAWQITTETFAYTNHTVMPEALECWALPLFERVLPRHLQLIYEINNRFLKEVAKKFPGDTELLKRVSLIEEGNPKRVRMAFLAIVGSHSVNGVSALHSELLKTQLFKDFYAIYPKKFNNKTNGITQRRWLKKSNPRLSDLISSKIGEGWITDLYELEKLTQWQKDKTFCKAWQKVKHANKLDLCEYIQKTTGVKINPHSMFDIQVKRIHEYKRQVLFALYVIREYLTLKDNPANIRTPRTFIFAGKAAPGYAMAKLIIKFITSIADVINSDGDNQDLLKVIFLENYRVSLAEKIFPASDLSEQISTAGTEASGTGCMKFMLNGALTVGTLDGANIEMAESAGIENMFIFGLKTEEVQEIKEKGYHPGPFIQRSPYLSEIFEMIRGNYFSALEPGIYEPLLKSLTESDPYMVCADFDAYCAMQDKISEMYRNQVEWTRRAILNVAKAGPFSSDRTIAEYARDIWHVKVEANSKKVVRKRAKSKK
ncbi:MAG: glycogen/starch/alpha-glucan phosphorylase [Candidatus Omnitrophica bacterium]|nr:glycogen/starch/alpha-glucan phosphorylase [Candidatus Omnitrophota bacterium]